MESLEQGHEPRARHPRVRRALVGTIIGAVILGALAWIADARWRDQARSDLARAFDETLSAVEVAERRVQSVSEYARPTRETLDSLVRDTAAESAADIAAERSRVDDVRLLPWHTDLHQARDDAGAWLDLRAGGIVSLAETGRAVYAPREQLDAARAALRESWQALTPGS